MIRCLLLAAASVAVAEDPLAQWLDSLKFSLEDVTTEKAGITFKVTQLVCRSAGDFESNLHDMSRGNNA